MQTFLAKCAAFAVLLGGFAVTGDFSRLAERGTDLLNATTVPEDTPQDEPPTESPAQPPRQAFADHAAPPVQAAASTPVAPAPEPPVRSTPAHASDAPLGRRVMQPPLPTNAPEAVDLARLRAGDRLLVWVGRSTAAPSVIAFDIVDPAAGEALEHRHLFEDEAAAVHAVPRRVRLAGESARAGMIMRGGMLRLLPTGIVHGTAGSQQPETLGPVQGMHVQQ